MQNNRIQNYMQKLDRVLPGTIICTHDDRAFRGAIREYDPSLTVRIRNAGYEYEITMRENHLEEFYPRTFIIPVCLSRSFKIGTERWMMYSFLLRPE